MNETRAEKEREFLIGLTELTRRTGVVIGGCGCCGSPFIDEVKHTATVDDPLAGYGYGFSGGVHWISPTDNYDWENYADSIVRASENEVGERDAH
jgi:hypothetical protein